MDIETKAKSVELISLFTNNTIAAISTIILKIKTADLNLFMTLNYLNENNINTTTNDINRCYNLANNF